MPLCDLLLQHLVDQLVLLDHRQALELGRLNLDRVHRSAAAADVLYLNLGQRAIHTRCSVPSPMLLWRVLFQRCNNFGMPLSSIRQLAFRV
jgi:hypothetical protein